MKILICTIKSWNIELAEELKRTCSDKHEIQIFTDKENLTVEAVKAYDPEIIFFPHWSYIIPEEIFENWQCIVFHMTDLPYGRGGSPLQNLIVRGHKETKISAIHVTKILDEGPVYCKEDLTLDGSAEEIFKKASDIIFHKMMPYIIEEKPEPVPQEGEVVVFKRRKPSQSELQAEMTTEEIYDYIRMLDAEGYPNAYVMLGKHKLSFTKARLENGKISCQVEISEVEDHE